MINQCLSGRTDSCSRVLVRVRAWVWFSLNVVESGGECTASLHSLKYQLRYPHSRETASASTCPKSVYLSKTDLKNISLIEQIISATVYMVTI